ncbi:MAG: toll/interleukin-1 receptor domain-containing protein [Bacteroidetes bacterium]|nr:toll/interleukin-1 receptor domain-containing protein [Bacteroidota bacterium]
MKDWKAFISHASEDKEQFVRKLYHYLTKLGLKIWYDEFTLKVGDSLSKSIDIGLKDSEYGIVIISKAFLEKNWTDYEYRSLLTREINGEKVILPIWYNITKEEISKYSLYLVDKFAIIATENNINQVALKLLEVIEPNIYKNISRYLYYKKLISEAEPSTAKSGEFKPSEIRHEKLNKSLVNRSEILYELIFKPFFGHKDLEETLDGFKRDLYPSREIQVWEAILAVYLIYSQKKEITDYVLLKDIVMHLVYFSTGNVYDKTYLETEQLLELMEMLNQRMKDL